MDICPVEKLGGGVKNFIDGLHMASVPKKIERPAKLLEYLGNKANKMMNRQDLSTEVLGFAHGSANQSYIW